MLASYYYINFSNYNNNEFIILLTMFAAAGFRLMPALTQSISAINSLRSSKSVVFDIYDALLYLDKFNESKNLKNKLDRNFKFNHKIKIDNLSYKYSKQDSYVLKKLNLEIKKGDCIGVVGTSGAGKTTFINILLGLLDFNEGVITLDSHEFKNISPLQQLTSYIPQNIFLLDDTILRNITFESDDKKIDFDLLNQVIDSSQLRKFIESQKETIYSIVGENGVKLSGGQRQRIAIARALYFKRDIIILDEATSALDTITENDIVQSINNLKGEKTIIVIAHRHSTLQNCDRIYSLNNGSLSIINDLD